MFSESTCLICYNKIARMAIEPRVCMVCQIKVKRKYIVNKLPLLSDYIQENIARMLVYDQKRCARLWHLEVVLLGRPLQLNWFRKLTYNGNGLRGNISKTEDIFHRVLSFLGRLDVSVIVDEGDEGDEGECYEGDEEE